MKDNLILTIGRQYGSGGLEIGRLLSEKLGIPCYDKELVTKGAIFRKNFLMNLTKKSSVPCTTSERMNTTPPICREIPNCSAYRRILSEIWRKRVPVFLSGAVPMWYCGTSPAASMFSCMHQKNTGQNGSCGFTL